LSEIFSFLRKSSHNKGSFEEHQETVGNCRKITKSSYLLFLTNRLVGDVLLATGFLSYLGPFNQNFRNLLLSRWEKEMSANKIPFSENLNLISMLTDAATVGVDLPYDALFI